MASRANQGTILLIGASGYLGSLVAAGLLSEGNSRLVAPLRQSCSREDLLKKIEVELFAEGAANKVDFGRLITIELPLPERMHELLPLMQQLNVSEIIHCAGSVDYFDSARLKEVNIDLTSELIFLGQTLGIERFVYLSTAFSSGYIDKVITETFHTSPKADPTEYTKSKREAELLLEKCGIPFLIIRPSIVIGDSRDGHYSGKAYGLYQLWSAFEKFLCDRYRPVLHFIAPEVKLQVVHQDAFKNGFLAARKYLPDNSIIHLISKQESLPTVREVTELWCQNCTKAKNVYYHSRFSDVPLDGLDRRIKTWLEFTEVNNNIAAYPWKFETRALDELRTAGIEFADATLGTIKVCQDRFVANSTRIQDFLQKAENI